MSNSPAKQKLINDIAAYIEENGTYEFAAPVSESAERVAKKTDVRWRDAMIEIMNDISSFIDRKRRS